MVLVMPFSTTFWICYIGGGLSDMLDGFIARKYKLQSAFGAKFDSFADIIFAIAITIVVIQNIWIPAWLWTCIAIIAFLRLLTYAIGFLKYHTFVALHTYSNKITGLLIFLFPMLFTFFGLTIAGVILCLLSFLSSIEEVFIIIKSKELNQNYKSIFIK